MALFRILLIFIIDNVIFGLNISGKSEKESKERAMEYLETFGLKDFAERYPKELSGGMKQRVAIIRSIINDSDSILMDESFSALDIQTRRKLQKIILKICKEQNKTIIFVTHDLDEAVFLSDKILILTKRPGTIKENVEVKLEHPRDRDSPEFVELVSKITDEIGESEDE